MAAIIGSAGQVVWESLTWETAGKITVAGFVINQLLGSWWAQWKITRNKGEIIDKLGDIVKELLEKDGVAKTTVKTIATIFVVSLVATEALNLASKASNPAVRDPLEGLVIVTAVGLSLGRMAFFAFPAASKCLQDTGFINKAAKSGASAGQKGLNALEASLALWAKARNEAHEATVRAGISIERALKLVDQACHA